MNRIVILTLIISLCGCSKEFSENGFFDGAIQSESITIGFQTSASILEYETEDGKIKHNLTLTSRDKNGIEKETITFQGLRLVHDIILLEDVRADQIRESDTLATSSYYLLDGDAVRKQYSIDKRFPNSSWILIDDFNNSFVSGEFQLAFISGGLNNGQDFLRPDELVIENGVFLAERE